MLINGCFRQPLILFFLQEDQSESVKSSTGMQINKIRYILAVNNILAMEVYLKKSAFVKSSQIGLCVCSYKYDPYVSDIHEYTVKWIVIFILISFRYRILHNLKSILDHLITGR